jgi:hypothetical protein
VDYGGVLFGCRARPGRRLILRDVSWLVHLGLELPVVAPEPQSWALSSRLSSSAVGATPSPRDRLAPCPKGRAVSELRKRATLAHRPADGAGAAGGHGEHPARGGSDRRSICHPFATQGSQALRMALRSGIRPARHAG